MKPVKFEKGQICENRRATFHLTNYHHWGANEKSSFCLQLQLRDQHFCIWLNSFQHWKNMTTVFLKWKLSSLLLTWGQDIRMFYYIQLCKSSGNHKKSVHELDPHWKLPHLSVWSKKDIPLFMNTAKYCCSKSGCTNCWHQELRYHQFHQIVIQSLSAGVA